MKPQDEKIQSHERLRDQTIETVKINMKVNKHGNNRRYITKYQFIYFIFPVRRCEEKCAIILFMDSKILQCY